LPEKWLLRYSWIADFLGKNYSTLWENSYNLIRMLEEKKSFISFIEWLPIMESVSVFVWEESISQYLKDYTIIVRPVEIAWYKGYIGLIGSLRMDYSFNISAIRWIL
jgi:transcriptional regulator of heat shock response